MAESGGTLCLAVMRQMCRGTPDGREDKHHRPRGWYALVGRSRSGAGCAFGNFSW